MREISEASHNVRIYLQCRYFIELMREISEASHNVRIYLQCRYYIKLMREIAEASHNVRIYLQCRYYIELMREKLKHFSCYLPVSTLENCYCSVLKANFYINDFTVCAIVSE